MVIAKWQYSLPVDISDAVYVNFVVRSYRQNVVRTVGATYFECFVRGEFSAIINFVADKSTEYCDDIMIEVAATTTEIAWAEMRDFVMAMEEVLLMYPGLKSTNQGKLKRYIVHSKDNRNEVSNLMDDRREMEHLRSEIPWLPPDFSWFIQRAWEKPGMLGELRAQKITLQLDHRLGVLKQLVVSGEPRQMPALWTLSYSSEAEAPKIELRIHSDLSGVCYHNPLRIAVPNDFVMRHTDLIQNGVSVLSVISSLIPNNVARTAVEMTLSASRNLLDRTQAVKSILDKAGLSRGEVKSAAKFGMSVQSRITFLRELLKIHDPSFDDMKVGELSNLCCTASNEGCYVWVHPDELEEMRGHLTPRYPSETSMTPLSCTTSNSTTISIRVTTLEWEVCTKCQKKLYCKWEIVHRSRCAGIGKTEKVANTGPSIAWSSPYKKLADVSSITMLRKSTVKVFLKRPHHLRKFLSGKVLGYGEIQLKDHVGMDSSTSSPIEIKIPLTGKNIPPRSTVTCEILIVQDTSSNP